jgi:outer membrane receptor for monomeric catechols
LSNPIHLVPIENYIRSMFSTVVLLQNEQFERANGFSNDYWGWGYEDGDLRKRLQVNGFAIDHRMGTFTPLLHKHRGATRFSPVHRDLILTNEARRNQVLFQGRWDSSSDTFRDEGLNTVAFTLSARRRIPSEERDIVIEHYGVQLFCGVDYALPKVSNCWGVAPIATQPDPKT